MTVHDFTSPRWGHNLEVMHWDKEALSGRAACWVNAKVKDGDILIAKSRLGTIRLVASEVKWHSNIGDMYTMKITPENSVVIDSELWVTKVKRNGGGYSILDVLPKEQAQALADEFNEQYQTDNYFIEKYDEAKHAYSRHG